VYDDLMYNQSVPEGFKLFSEFVYKESNYNVEVNVINEKYYSFDAGYGPPLLHFHCKKCGTVEQTDFNNSIYKYLDLAAVIVKEHRHGGIKKTYEDYTKTYDFYSYAGIKYDMKDFNSPQPYLPEKWYKSGDKVEIPDSLDSSLMGSFTVHNGGKSFNSVSVTQELLKDIAKLSHFNVDLQAKVKLGIATDYRAVCTKCKEYVVIDYDQLISTARNNDTWSILTVFCEEHTHIAVTINKGGRKFKEVQ